MTGSISLLVSKDMRALVTVTQNLDREVAKQLRRHTRTVAQKAFQEEIESRASTRQERKVLASTARVAVSDTNVTMRTATIGKTSTGTPASTLAAPVEFGASPDRLQGMKGYTRRMGTRFRPPRRKGYVFFPAAGESSARLAALWFQTVYRTVADEIEGA